MQLTLINGKVRRADIFKGGAIEELADLMKTLSSEGLCSSRLYPLSISTGYPELSGECTWRKDRLSNYIRRKLMLRDEITIHRTFYIERFFRLIGLAAILVLIELFDPRGSRVIKNPKISRLSFFAVQFLIQFAISLCNFETRSH